MKNLMYLMSTMLLLTILLSCEKEGIEVSPLAETAEVLVADETSTLSVQVQSLSEINLKRLSTQLPQVENHFKQIANADYSDLFKDHNLDDLYLNEDYVFVEEKADFTTYTFIGTIPHSTDEEQASQYVYISVNLDDIAGMNSEAVFGFQMDYSVSFDEQGSIINNDYATAKNGNKPAKAPSSVICAYARRNPAFNVGPVQSYCGTWGTSTVPAPQSVLDALFNPNPLTHNYNDLYILVPTVSTVSVHIQYNIPWGETDFGNYTNSAFPDLKDKIIDFYQSVYIPQLGRPITVTSNITAAKHVNKQAFIDSFFEWMYRMQVESPYNNYSYMVQHPEVLYTIFEIFSTRNTNHPEDEGVYLGLANGNFSPTPDIVCLTLAGDYLYTLNGRILMAQLNSGSITAQQFEDALPGC